MHITSCTYIFIAKNDVNFEREKKMESQGPHETLNSASIQSTFECCNIVQTEDYLTAKHFLTSSFMAQTQTQNAPKIIYFLWQIEVGSDM